jgi:hypothetical protein
MSSTHWISDVLDFGDTQGSIKKTKKQSGAARRARNGTNFTNPVREIRGLFLNTLINPGFLDHFFISTRCFNSSSQLRTTLTWCPRRYAKRVFAQF